MEIQGPLENFFKSPDQAPDPNGDGILYSIRADLEKLYGKESEIKENPSSHAMLALTGILIGIDYISQCYLGKQSGTAFVESLMELGRIDWDNADAMYQMRCALLTALKIVTLTPQQRYPCLFG